MHCGVLGSTPGFHPLGAIGKPPSRCDNQMLPDIARCVCITMCLTVSLCACAVCFSPRVCGAVSSCVLGGGSACVCAVCLTVCYRVTVCAPGSAPMCVSLRVEHEPLCSVWRASLGVWVRRRACVWERLCLCAPVCCARVCRACVTA